MTNWYVKKDATSATWLKLVQPRVDLREIFSWWLGIFTGELTNRSSKNK